MPVWRNWEEGALKIRNVLGAGLVSSLLARGLLKEGQALRWTPHGRRVEGRTSDPVGFIDLREVVKNLLIR